MEIKIYQVDAFAERTFEGNPAAVCPLKEWISDDILQKIAEENNLSETAFFVTKEKGFSLRWFTPEAEVDLCGHATLAAAHVLFRHIGYSEDTIEFYTKSGVLEVAKSGYGYSMSFPSSIIEPFKAPSDLVEGLGIAPTETYSAFDYIVVLDSEAEVMSLTPDFSRLKNLDLRGVVVTAPGDNVDFVSRCFFPKLRVDEDPVTGSAHCEIAPYWAKTLNKNKLIGKQMSKRTGVVQCEVIGDRVILIGKAMDYMSGLLTIKT